MFDQIDPQMMATMMLNAGGRLLSAGGAGERTSVGLGQALMGGVSDYYTLLDRAEKKKQEAARQEREDLQMKLLQQQLEEKTKEQAMRAKMAAMADPMIQMELGRSIQQTGGVPFSPKMIPQGMTPDRYGLAQSPQVLGQQVAQNNMQGLASQFISQFGTPEQVYKTMYPEQQKAATKLDSFVAQIGNDRNDVRQVFMVPNDVGQLTPHSWNGETKQYEIVTDKITPISVTDVRSNTGVDRRFDINQANKIIESTKGSLEKLSKLDQVAELSREIFNNNDFKGTNAAQLQQLISNMSPTSVRAQAELEKFGAPGGLIDNFINTTKKLTTGTPSTELIQQYNGLLNNLEKYLRKTKEGIINQGEKQASYSDNILKYYKNVYDNYLPEVKNNSYGLGQAPQSGYQGSWNYSGGKATLGAPRQDKPIWGQ